MNKKILLDCSLILSNAHFRAVFIARTISLLGLGLLVVALPKQVYEISGDTLQVGLVLALEGAGLFAGLLLGGVLADRYDRKKLIVLARSICGLGYATLTVNALFAQASLSVIYTFSLWNGFFGALGISALLASMPHIVGREKLLEARAISMLSMRLIGIAAPALAGLIISLGSVAWAYGLTTLGTIITVISLLHLPSMRPSRQVDHVQPITALFDALKYICNQPLIRSLVIMGALISASTAIRIFFPELVAQYFSNQAWVLGLFYAAVPAGAACGAFLSGWAQNIKRPGKTMTWVSIAVFTCVVAFGLTFSLTTAYLWPTLLCLFVFGYLNTIASLLQYTLLQAHTPDHYLGRVNGLWTALDAGGDSLAMSGAAILAKIAGTTLSIVSIGTIALAISATIMSLSSPLRRACFEPALEAKN
ncbi:enterobactin transporter EntS [Agaribacterium sp. ZY112]|uniref:enterobactin transporter EntS n=1 Tax=Agaribacterium sp. ZY112 TaxID=3233574 RepID=UPI003524CAF8